MCDKTSRAFVSSKARIEKFESISIIGTVRTSGATAKYMVKEDFPTLLELTEGRFAKDIYLKVDDKRKRILIEDTEISFEEEFSDFAKGSEFGEDSDMGILEAGLAVNLMPSDSLERLGKEDKVVFWFNGIWTIINKHEQNGDILIPVELARRVIGRTNESTINILSQLNKTVPDKVKYECVSARQLAEKLGMKDLYSQWVFDGKIHVMMNPAMRNGPYKLQRKNNEIWIRFSLQFIDANSNVSGVKKITIAGIDDYVENVTTANYTKEIKLSFSRWQKSYDEDETAKFGYKTIKVYVDVGEKYTNSVDVSIINTYLKNDKTRHASHVTAGDNWNIGSVGKVYMYNHFEDEYGNMTELDKQTYGRHSAHEFGHLLGLGDAYNGASESDEVTTDDIMWYGEDISANDMEMVFLAVLKNKKQYFYSKGDKVISDAISMGKKV